jgi:hypothetical protein
MRLTAYGLDPAPWPGCILRFSVAFTSSRASTRLARRDGNMKKSSGSNSAASGSPSERINARIADLGDWRGELLSTLRNLIKEAVPAVIEEWKWRGTPVWEHNGMICTGETYKDKVKVTFAKGAALEDPSGLFNSSLDGNVRRAIDFPEGGKVDKKAFKALIRSAAELNDAAKSPARQKTSASPTKKAAKPPAKKAAKSAARKKA